MNTGMFEQEFQQAQSSAHALAQIAFFLWIAVIVLAIGVAIWMFVDAEARGKSGIAAAMVTIGSAFYGLPAIVVVVGSWMLLRPAKKHEGSKPLPDKLPSDLVSGPSSEEFLGTLAKN